MHVRVHVRVQGQGHGDVEVDRTPHIGNAGEQEEQRRRD